MRRKLRGRPNEESRDVSDFVFVREMRVRTHTVRPVTVTATYESTCRPSRSYNIPFGLTVVYYTGFHISADGPSHLFSRPAPDGLVLGTMLGRSGAEDPEDLRYERKAGTETVDSYSLKPAAGGEDDLLSQLRPSPCARHGLPVFLSFFFPFRNLPLASSLLGDFGGPGISHRTCRPGLGIGGSVSELRGTAFRVLSVQ